MFKDKIEVIIEDIEKYFEELKEMDIKKIEDMNILKFRAASMNIFSIINRTIDLAEEVATSENLGFPSEYKELFTLLRIAKIIDENQEDKLKDLVILRNKLSHRYGIIKKEDILQALKRIEVVKKFIKDVIKETKKTENK